MGENKVVGEAYWVSRPGDEVVNMARVPRQWTLAVEANPFLDVEKNGDVLSE